MSEPAELSVTKAEHAYRRVRELIFSGALPPGAVIAQAKLARDIGISTTPLREALRRLKSEGLVELDAHRDAKVAPLVAEEARDLLELRRALDPMAAELAAERRSKSDIAAIRAAGQDLKPLPGDPTMEQLIAHRRFHTAIYTASHNELLIQTLDALWDKADRYRLLALAVDRGQEARDRKAAEHAALLDCIVAGDGSGAAEVMRTHVDTSLGAQAAWRLRKPSGPTAESTAEPAAGGRHG
jgi:DNA-binding GntR family transcriptional regulator